MSTEPDDDLKADWSAKELSVLRSADRDAPPHGAVERALTAIGAGAALGAGIGVGTASSVGGAAQLGRMAHGSMWLKWASAALVGCGIAGAVFLHRRPQKVAPVAASPPVLTAPATPTAEPTSTVAEAPNAAPAVLAQPAAPVAALPQASIRADSSAKPDAGKDDIAAEIRIIDAARGYLRRGDPQGSLAALADYDKLVKHGGSMRAEATVVRIEAYQASGDFARASALGQRFLAKNPDSPYADYVKRILAKAN